MWYLCDEWQAQERFQKLLREAEQHRRVVQVMEDHMRTRRSSKLLAGLGSQLIVWGARLQTRYQSTPVSHG